MRSRAKKGPFWRPRLAHSEVQIPGIQQGWSRIEYSAIIASETEGRKLMASAETLELMSAEEFGKRPDPGFPEELFRGRVVAMPVPDRRHGYLCLNVGRILGDFVAKAGIGRVMSNDSGIITGRNPDTVRGADIAFYSFDRLPKGALAPGYGPEVPELVVEIRSPSDRWRDIHEKITEYLNAGVTTVV